MTEVTANPAHDRQFHRLLEKLPAAAYTCDAQGIITYYNPLALEVWGRSPQINNPADRYCGSLKLFSTDGQAIHHNACWMARAIIDGKEYNGREIVIERPDGQRRVALAHANPYFDSAGRVCGAVNVLIDITDRKRNEDSLRVVDRRKTEFLATLAHELRNPLAPLRSGLQIMRMPGADSAAVERARAMMDRQVQHLVRLIDDLIDLSRITNGVLVLRRKPFDLMAAVNDAVETSRPAIEAAGHILTIAAPQTMIEIDGDRTRLAQVFVNLLNNSAKYTPAGGKIAVSVQRFGSDAVVSVKDSGIGIPPDQIPHIFEMFSRSHHSRDPGHGGLGIGLSLARSLVEMHGGRIEASSHGPGKGSEFVVRLPAVVAPPRREDQMSNPDRASATRYRVLVVDDNRDAAESMSLLLQIVGHDVRTAHDGQQALDTAAEFQPNVVLLDIGLPKLNGYDVCRQLRQRGAGRQVIIAVTGWGQDEDRRLSKEAGFDFHMVKPVDPDALSRLLSDLLTPA